MKFTRVNRVLLAFVLASGIQLSLTTCTNSGVVRSSEDNHSLEEIISEEVEEVVEEVVFHHR